MELNLAALVSISLVSLAILVSLLSRKKRQQQPPGPRCLPFIGNLLDLLTSEPHVAFRDLARKHGPVMYLRLGHVDTVVISSPATAQQVLQDSTINFASRPRLLTPEILGYGGTDIAFAPYGPYWRTLRKLCAVELLSARKVRQFATIRDRETLAIVASVTAAAAAGKTVNLTRLFLTCANEITAKVVFGEGIKDEGDLEFPIGTKTVKAIILDFFTGGTDPTASTVEWIMSELMRYPEIMAKVQEEVRRTLDNKSPQDHESHMHELHYMKLVIKEVLRLHPPLPLLLPRVCRETCDIGGFKVLEGYRVIVNVWAIGRDPEHWQDAEVFRPERFKDFVEDYKGIQFEYLPFGSGRRMCPGGNTFGMAIVELMLARLLYYFDWKLPVGVRVDELDMDTIGGIPMKRRSSLHLRATPYNVPTNI
ncbi:unnamed protein product [Alopecurus aequalis]